MMAYSNHDDHEIILCPHYTAVGQGCPRLILLWEPQLKPGALPGIRDYVADAKPVFLALCPTCSDVLRGHYASEVMKDAMKLVGQEMLKGIKDTIPRW